MVIEVEQPVDRRLRDAQPARKFGLSYAGGPESHIELRFCPVQGANANHAVLPAARLTGARNLLALPDQLSNHGANRVRSHLPGFLFRVALGHSPTEVGEPDDKATFFGGIENRGVFHAISPLS